MAPLLPSPVLNPHAITGLQTGALDSRTPSLHAATADTVIPMFGATNKAIHLMDAMALSPGSVRL